MKRAAALVPILGVIATVFGGARSESASASTLTLAQAAVAAAPSAVCEASDAAGLKTCRDRAQRGELAKVRIVAMIACSGLNACSFELNGVQRPLEIEGNGHATGLTRVDSFGSSLVKVTASSSVTLRNLTLLESGRNRRAGVVRGALVNGACDVASCANTVEFLETGDVVLDRVVIENSRASNLALRNVQSLTIRDSHIRYAFKFGVVFGAGVRDVDVHGTSFFRNGSNAMIVSAQARDASKPSLIHHNTFDRNHWYPAFWTCGGGSEACAGGQLAIEPNTHHLVVRDNIFRTGSMDDRESNVMGIEISEKNPVSGLQIVRNRIYDHTAEGILDDSMNTSSPRTSGIKVAQNAVYRNHDAGRSQIVVAEPLKASNNCFAEGCIDTSTVVGAGLGCEQDRCIWIAATKVMPDCKVTISPSSRPELWSVVDKPDCKPEGVSFVIPDALKGRGSVRVSISNPDGTRSEPVAVTLR